MESSEARSEVRPRAGRRLVEQERGIQEDGRVARPGITALIMTIDFTPLPMTDLRSRPGEILDRVIDNGESFVIERNGRQRACLVPLSVFLPDVSPARIANELKELEKAGE